MTWHGEILLDQFVCCFLVIVILILGRLAVILGLGLVVGGVEVVLDAGVGGVLDAGVGAVGRVGGGMYTEGALA